MKQAGSDFSFKQRVYDCCVASINEKISMLQHQLAELRESVAGETKSTAGDKYETARAMIHIEQAQINRQLSEAQSQQALLNKIDPKVIADHVVRGSLVYTNKGLFFISISLGKLVVCNEINVVAISPQSPLGAQLLGLKKGDNLSVNGNQYSITKIE